MNLSLKDFKLIIKENQTLKDSLKELKSREILLMAKLDSIKESQYKSEKENKNRLKKSNKWGNEMSEIEKLQEEINGSLLEMEKSQSKIFFIFILDVNRQIKAGQKKWNLIRILVLI
jgi:hypothetical protein